MAVKHHGPIAVRKNVEREEHAEEMGRALKKISELNQKLTSTKLQASRIPYLSFTLGLTVGVISEYLLFVLF